MIVIAVYLMTGGERLKSEAQFDTHTFTEDFTTDTYKDASATTADWDMTGESTPGEAMLHHGAWTNIQDQSIKGPQSIPGILSSKVAFNPTTNIRIGPDNQPYIIFDTHIDVDPPGASATDDANIWYTHWNPNFYGVGQGEWVKIDGTKGADRITPNSGPSKFLSVAGGYRTILRFDSNDLPVVAYWARIYGHAVETYVQRWCASPATIPGASVFNAWGNVNCTSTDPSQVSVDPYSSCLRSMALDSKNYPHLTYEYCSSATHFRKGHYTRWDGTKWSKADGSAGVDDLEISPLNYRALAAFATVDSKDQVYIGIWKPQIASSNYDLIAYKSDPYHGVGWHGLDGAPAGTLISDKAQYPSSNSIIAIIAVEINPVTDLPHFFYGKNFGSPVGVRTVNQAWDGTQFVDFAGQPGFDMFDLFASRIHGSALGSVVFDPSQPRGYPQLLSTKWYYSGLSYFSHWNGTNMVPHLKQSLPEEIPPVGSSFTTGFFHMDVNNEGVPFVVSWASVSEKIDAAIMRYTPEWADNSRGHLQSKAVDSVDQPIVAATLTWNGESRGFGGTSGPTTAIPFSAQGRNQLTDVDCSLSNDGGQHFYPVQFGQEFSFPKLGSNLIWSCDLDSGTKLDNPTLFDLKIDYKTTKQSAGLQIIKNSDTNGDGVFTDNGQAVSPGQELTYQLKIANTGETAATNVVVKDPIPPGTTYVAGSTKVSGVAVGDPTPGVSPLESGVNIGSVAAGAFLQYNWQGGDGQTSFSNVNKFSSEQFTDYSQLEVLKTQTGELYPDKYFAPPNQSKKLDDGTTGVLGSSLKGAVMLQDGRLFTVWHSASTRGIYGRFFDRQGNPLSGQLLLSLSGPTDPNERPSAAQLSGGDIAVIWNRLGFGNSASNIVMRRFNNQGVPQTGEVIIANEPKAIPPPVPPQVQPFVHTDWKSTPSKPPKSPLVVDQANNFYVALLRQKSGTCSSSPLISGLTEASVAGFKADGTPLFPETIVSGSACDVSQAPSLAINGHNKIAAVYPRINGTNFSLELTTLNTSGAILSGPTVVHAMTKGSGPGTFFKLAEIAALPVDANPDRFVISFGEGSSSSSSKTYLKIVDETGSTINGPITLSNNVGELPSLAIDGGRQRIFVAQPRYTYPWSMQIKAFDFMLTAIGQPLETTSISFMRNPSLAIDPSTKRLWTTWASGFFNYFGSLSAYSPQEHSLLSSVYDAGNTTEFTDLSVTAEAPAGTSISYQARAGDVSTPDGSWTSFTPLTPGTPFSLKGRYLQYKVVLDNSGDVNATPILHDLTISHNGPIIVEYKVKVSQNGGVLTNAASATADNISSVVTTSNQAQNPILPASTTRTGGDDRIDTSVLLSNNLYPDQGSAKAICLVRSDDPVDALPGSPFCSQVEAPILLTAPHNLDTRTLQEIKRVLAPTNKIYLLGGPAALGPEVRSALTTAGYTNQEQIGGTERRETSKLVAEKLLSFEPAVVTRAGVANAYTAADALSLSAPAAVLKPGSTRFPVLLTANNELTDPVKDFLAAHPKITTIYTAGGDKVIGDKVLEFLQNLSQKPQIISFKGQNRFATTTLVAEHFFPVPSQIFAMSGFAFPARTPGGVPIDALLAGPAAAKGLAPLIYVTRDLPLPREISDYLKDNKGQIGLIQIIGGTTAVSNEIQQEMLSTLKQ